MAVKQKHGGKQAGGLLRSPKAMKQKNKPKAINASVAIKSKRRAMLAEGVCLPCYASLRRLFIAFGLLRYASGVLRFAFGDKIQGRHASVAKTPCRLLCEAKASERSSRRRSEASMAASKPKAFLRRSPCCEASRRLLLYRAPPGRIASVGLRPLLI
jgi:hypothetical protein